MKMAVAVVANELCFEHAGGLGVGDRPRTGRADVGHASTVLAVDRVEADEIRALIANHERTLAVASQPRLKRAVARSPASASACGTDRRRRIGMRRGPSGER